MEAKDVEEDTPTESDWLFEYIDGVMKSPAWDSEVNTFIDDNCVIFDNEEENKLEYTLVHEKYSDLLEELMTKHLKEVSITPEAFAEACEKARFASRGNKRVFEQLVALTDFLTFKKLMVKRNMDLEIEALHELQQQAIPIIAPVDEEEAEKLFQMALKESAEMSASEAQSLLDKARAEAENSKEAEPGDKGAASDAELRKAMDINLMELELQNRQFEMEQQELEQALAMSLFMEEERIRLAKAYEEQEDENDDENDDDASYEDVDESLASAVSEVKEERGSKQEEGSKSEAKGTIVADTDTSISISEPKLKTEIVSNSAKNAVEEEDGVPIEGQAPVRDAKDSHQTPLSFNPTSLQAAPKLLSPCNENTVVSSKAEGEVVEEIIKKKKKKKSKRPDKSLNPILSPSPISSTPSSGLAPLPSIEELQKQMQKRRLEAEDAFRKNQQVLTQQRQTEKELTVAAGVTAEDASRRAAYLKEQRDKLLAKKRAEREMKAKQYEDEKEKDIATMMAESSSSTGGGGGGGDSDAKGNEADERRNMMRIALARRMKRDLLVTESERLRTVQDEQYTNLDKQLRMVQGLREENLARERELGDQIRRQQEQRFRNLQTSVATQVLEH